MATSPQGPGAHQSRKIQPVSLPSCDRAKIRAASLPSCGARRGQGTGEVPLWAHAHTHTHTGAAAAAARQQISLSLPPDPRDRAPDRGAAGAVRGRGGRRWPPARPSAGRRWVKAAAERAAKLLRGRQAAAGHSGSGDGGSRRQHAPGCVQPRRLAGREPPSALSEGTQCKARVCLLWRV